MSSSSAALQPIFNDDPSFYNRTLFNPELIAAIATQISIPEMPTALAALITSYLSEKDLFDLILKSQRDLPFTETAAQYGEFLYKRLQKNPIFFKIRREDGLHEFDFQSNDRLIKYLMFHLKINHSVQARKAYAYYYLSRNDYENEDSSEDWQKQYLQDLIMANDFEVLSTALKLRPDLLKGDWTRNPSHQTLNGQAKISYVDLAVKCGSIESLRVLLEYIPFNEAVSIHGHPDIHTAIDYAIMCTGKGRTYESVTLLIEAFLREYDNDLKSALKPKEEKENPLEQAENEPESKTENAAVGEHIETALTWGVSVQYIGSAVLDHSRQLVIQESKHELIPLFEKAYQLLNLPLAQLSSAVAELTKTNANIGLKPTLSPASLQAYYSNTELQEEKEKSLDAVRKILKQHCRRFAFSTLPANLAEEDIEAEENSLAQDLLSNESGLCFHHNSTVKQVLENQGYQVDLIACRFPRRNSSKLYPISTHAAILLTFDNKQYLLDPGLGFGIHDVIPVLDQTPGRQYWVKKDNACPEYLELRGRPTGLESKEEERLIYAFDLKPRDLSYFTSGISTLKRADNISDAGFQQGHAFYTLFYYSRNHADNDRLECVQAMVRPAESSSPNRQSIYRQWVTIFNPSEMERIKLQTGVFTNKDLKPLVYRDFEEIEGEREQKTLR